MQICMIVALLRTCLTGGLTPQSAIWNSWLLQTLGKMVNHLQDPLLRNTKIKMGKNCRPVWAKSDIFWLSFSCFVKIVWWCVERMKGKYWHWQHWDHIHIWHPPLIFKSLKNYQNIEKILHWNYEKVQFIGGTNMYVNLHLYTYIYTCYIIHWYVIYIHSSYIYQIKYHTYIINIDYTNYSYRVYIYIYHHIYIIYRLYHHIHNQNILFIYDHTYIYISSSII
jgi:hypothetical protein